MQASLSSSTSARYAKCIEVSKRIRWDIDRDVIRGRTFDLVAEVPARRPVAHRSACASFPPAKRSC